MNAFPYISGESSTGTVTAVVIGAGHAGLAMSYCLTQRGIDHIVLERGQIASAWLQDRWDSLRLLTPNWQSRLPGYRYRGRDPDGFMTAAEVAGFIVDYARVISAPVKTGVTVTSMVRAGDNYQVITDCGSWRCQVVVIATGAFSTPVVPIHSKDVPGSIVQHTAKSYRNPNRLPQGDVLVIGGSATGLQLAQEIQNSGRQVTLAVGEHVRMPRIYRGMDILWWMNASGILDERYDQTDDIDRARRVPSPQLVGSPDRITLDLNALQSRGVRVAGRMMGVHDGKAQFSGSLKNVCALADLKMGRLLDRIDEWAGENGMGIEVSPPERYPDTLVEEKPILNLDLERNNISSIVWATGFRPDYSWLDVPVFDRKGNLRHDGGVVESPGMYVLGLPFMRRRKSSFIHGAEDDVRDLSAHLAGYLDSLSKRRSIDARIPIAVQA